ncbi:hypothetical protein NDU88_010893 [Pleurodeles waltl]|uniref:Uncharacterized protein n=1 Tax=Pleurodeles waltl TaxID=8319 RepID=A0AAV7S0Y0_PLEWA|nr:hypothetical protein NDU88_010893 [Pleurodeles waltl]
MFINQRGQCTHLWSRTSVPVHREAQLVNKGARAAEAPCTSSRSSTRLYLCPGGTGHGFLRRRLLPAPHRLCAPRRIRICWVREEARSCRVYAAESASSCHPAGTQQFEPESVGMFNIKVAVWRIWRGALHQAFGALP